MNNKESIKQFCKVLEVLLEEKGLCLNLHRPEIDVIDNKYFNMVKKVQEILNNDELDDFLKIDELVKLLLDNGFDTHCHDFG
jgi:hypothetical protein